MWKMILCFELGNEMSASANKRESDMAVLIADDALTALILLAQDGDADAEQYLLQCFRKKHDHQGHPLSAHQMARLYDFIDWKYARSVAPDTYYKWNSYTL